MRDLIDDDMAGDLLARGYSRRHFGRVAGLLAGGAALAGSRALAQGAPVKGLVRIDANECWTGPLAPAVAASAASIANGNRYSPNDERGDFIKTVAAVEDLPVECITPWPGSSDPLARIVVSYCSPGRGLVTANPTFELAGSVGQWLGVKVTQVPLRSDYAHDVKGMLAADPNAGVYYICTPNNPSATLTSLPDVEWLIANKPAGSIVLLDEAYIHFAGAPTGSYLVKQGKDVIVLRTFSKIFGMAGMRMGITLARPDLIAKVMRYDGQMSSWALPIPTVVAATESLRQPALVKARREEMIKVRTETFALLEKKGVPHMPSSANFFMVDWGRPAKEMQTAFAAQGVSIGRSWPIWPNRSRVTVGSASDMAAFGTALGKVMA